MPEPGESFLVVDDDIVLRPRLARALRERGYDVREAEDVASARAAAIAGAHIAWALVDLRLPDGSGLDVVRTLTEHNPGAKIVVLTGYGSIANALEAVRLGATNYLTKPATVDEVLAAFDTRPTETAEPASDADVPSLARVEWEHINRVLQDSGGNISEAARRLGMHRRSLQRKLSKKPTRR